MMKAIIRLKQKPASYFNARIENNKAEMFCEDKILSLDNINDIEVLLKGCWLGDVYEKVYQEINEEDINHSVLESYESRTNGFYEIEWERWDENEEWEEKKKKYLEELEEGNLSTSITWKEYKPEDIDGYDFSDNLKMIIKNYLK
jgi:hypothetical protein